MSPGPALTGCCSLWGVCGLVQAQLGNGPNQLAVFAIGSVFARVCMDESCDTRRPNFCKKFSHSFQTYLLTLQYKGLISVLEKLVVG